MKIISRKNAKRISALAAAVISAAFMMTSCGSNDSSEEKSVNISSEANDYSYLLSDPDNVVGKGYVVLHDEEDYPNELKDLRFVHGKGKTYTVTDFYGNEVFSGTSDMTPMFCEGLAAYRDENGLMGYMDIDGNTVITPKYTYAEAFCNGSALVKTDDEEFYIDMDGNKTQDHRYDGYEGSFDEYDYYRAFTGKYLVAMKRSAEGGYIYSYLDKNGKAYEYSDSSYISSFQNGYAIIDKDGYPCVIDENMNIVANLGDYEDPMYGAILSDNVFGLVEEIEFWCDVP